MKILLLVCALGVTAGSGLPAPMRFGPHCVLAASLILSGTPAAQLPPPGNPGHVEPPPGQHCARDEKTPASHRCECHRECKQNTDENGQPAPGGYIVEDVARCRVACFKASCFCPVENCE